jgi:hypothetical protein
MAVLSAELETNSCRIKMKDRTEHFTGEQDIGFIINHLVIDIFNYSFPNRSTSTNTPLSKTKKKEVDEYITYFLNNKVT